MDVIPEELRTLDKLEEFLLWLRMLPVDIMTKKYILLSWCEWNSVKCRAEWIEFVTEGRGVFTRG